MSGICGLMRFDGRPVDAGSLRLMLDGLQSWGQPGAPPLISASGRSGLGVRVSRVTPEDEHDRQPLVSRDGRLSLVADARLDNRSELGAMLGLSSSEAAVMPDSAYILAAWGAWSEASVTRLVGDFAFLLWDEREQTLWAARDHIGQRVLYYHSTPARVALASSPAALLALGDVPPRLNERKLGELLVDIRDRETTCVEGILRVLPAHLTRVSPEGSTRRRYWSFEDCSDLRFRSTEECSDAFRDVLGRAVRDRLRSRQGVAVALSAGLDSSSVTALAAAAMAEQGGRLSAYHAAPAAGPLARPRDGWVLDESDDVAAIARMYESVDLSVLRGPWSKPLDEAVAIFPALFAPIRNVVNVPWYLDIYRRARADGANVLLTGGWGNFTISASGDRWLHEIGRSGQLLRLIREVRAFAAARRRGVWDVVKGEVLLPVIPDVRGAFLNRLRRQPARPPIWERTHSPVRAEFARSQRLEELSVAHGLDSPTLDRQRLTAGRIAGFRTAGDLFDVTHALRARFDIETREPAADVRVVRFCLGVPGKFLLSGGKDRRLVRDGMSDLLPRQVLDRTTRGTQAADWSQQVTAMRVDIEHELAALATNDLAQRCLDLPRLQQLMQHWPAAFDRDHFPDYGIRLMRAIMVGRFIRWFDQERG